LRSKSVDRNGWDGEDEIPGRNDVAKAVKRICKNVTKVLQFSHRLGERKRNAKCHRRRAIGK